MEARILKLVLDTIGTIDNVAKSLNINKKAIEVHTGNFSIVMKKLDGYMEKYKNKEYMNTLSPPEQKALGENAQALIKTREELLRELDYLDLSKTPTFVGNATHALDRAYLQIEYMITNMTGEPGELIIPKFSVLRPKDSDTADYSVMVSTLTAELDAQCNDIYQDHIKDSDGTEGIILFISAYMLICEGYMWISKEKERLKTEALPEIKEIKIPDEILPEFPKAPENKN
jgi:hypothetical protein